MLTLFQSLAFAAGFDSANGPGNPCNTPSSSSKCVIPWIRGTMTVSGAVMIANSVGHGVSVDTGSHSATQVIVNAFQSQIMIMLFVTNSAADYGNNGKWMLLGCSVLCWASQFAAMSLLGTFFIFFLFYRPRLIAAYLSEHRQTRRDGLLLWYYLWSASFPMEPHSPSISQYSPAWQGTPLIQEHSAKNTRMGRSHRRNMKGKKVSNTTGSVIIVRLVSASYFTDMIWFYFLNELGFQSHRSDHYAMPKSFSAITIGGWSSSQ